MANGPTPVGSRRPSNQAGAPMTVSEAMQEEAWISCEKIDELLNDKISILACTDGSDQCTCGLEMCLRGFTMTDRATKLDIVHFYDDSKTYLPPRLRRDAIQADVEAKCTSYLPQSRYSIRFRPKPTGKKVGQELCTMIEQQNTSFVCLGFKGRSGRKDKHIVGSNVMEVMQRGKCSAIIFRTENPKELPINRPTRFLVSASLNVAATKAFVDALRLSKKGDEIHVVYIRPFLESHSAETARTLALREKYDGFFAGLKDSEAWPSGKMSKFGDRDVKLVFAPQGMGEGIVEALVRYAENWEADFVLVGTNALRVNSGKEYLGSISLQIAMEFEGNVVVSNYMPTPEQQEKWQQRQQAKRQSVAS